MIGKPSVSVGAGHNRKRLLTVSMNYDDIVLLVGLVKSYFGGETPVAEVHVTGSRLYSWDDLDRFQEECPRLSWATTMVMSAATDSKKVEITFSRKSTRLLVTGPDEQGAQRLVRRMTDFLMSTRPRLWPSYKQFFERPKLTVAVAALFLTASYLFNRDMLGGALVLAIYVIGSVLWLNPTKITFKDRGQLREDREKRMKGFVTTPISVLGGLLGIISTAFVILGHLH